VVINIVFESDQNYIKDQKMFLKLDTLHACVSYKVHVLVLGTPHRVSKLHFYVYVLGEIGVQLLDFLKGL